MKMKKQINTPFIADRLLKLFLSDDEYLEFTDDIGEIYQSMVRSDSKLEAHVWYWLRVLESLPSIFSDNINWRISMFKNYLKIALRNIKKHKGYSFINIAGLSIGMACCILILLWVRDELNFNRFHENSNDIYMVFSRVRNNGNVNIEAGSPPAIGPALKIDYPEISNSARIANGSYPVIVRYGEKIFNESLIAGDPSVFDIFTFPLIQGTSPNTLSDPHSIVISETVADKYFGSENPVGKVLKIDNKYDFKVSGVMKNIPSHSTIRFDLLVPLKFIEEYNGRKGYLRTWYNLSFMTYVLLHKDSNMNDVNTKIAGRIKQGDANQSTEPILYPFRNFYLHGLGNINQVRTFTLIAFLVLLIACINFMNLTTARAGTRAKEIGLRKVSGAYRINIIKQFFSESVLLSFLSLVLSLVIVRTVLPFFNVLVEKDLSLDIMRDPAVLLGISGLTIVTGVISGSYPALFLSSFKPVKVLKGTAVSSRGFLRKALVIVQFVLSVILIIRTAVVYQQLDYMHDMDLGFKKDNLILIRMEGNLKQQYEAAKRDFLASPEIINVTSASHVPNYIGWDGRNWEWEGRSPETNPWVTYFSGDIDFIKTFEMEMVQGAFYSETITGGTSESLGKIVINEELANIMRLENTVGSRISHEGNTYEITGVIKSFHFKPLHREIQPLVFFYKPERHRFIFLKVSRENSQLALNHIEQVYKKFNPDFPFSYRFLDDLFNTLYSSTRQSGAVLRYFAFLVIFISSLGLLGLASFVAEQRTKEIGIRKVLGSSVSNVVFLLSRDFLKWIIAANLIAWPIAWYLSNNWLQNFVYRINIEWWIFILTGFSVLFIALITASYRSVRAAMINPVDALKYD